MYVNKTKKRMDIVCFVVFEFFFIISAILINLRSNEILKISNKQTTMGIITDIVNIKQYSRRRKYEPDNYYSGILMVEYEVDGKVYYKEETVSSYKTFNSPESDYSIGDEIKIAYNSKLPAESAVYTLEYYKFVIYPMIGIIFSLIFIIYTINSKRFIIK